MSRSDAADCLTRHFIRHFLDVGLMSTEGADGVRRVLLGLMSATIAFGLLLARMMMGKYLGIRGVADLYERAVVGDTLMILGLAMLVAGFAAALAGDSMFPDETDFRVLTPLPIARRFVFAAKLRAVALYLGLVIGVASCALQLPFTLLASGPHAPAPWVVRAAAHVGVSVAASLFAALAVMAIHGVIVLCAPRRYLRPMSVASRTAMLCSVVLLLPLVGRLPSQWARFQAESPLLYLAPPVWFTGLQRVSIGAGAGAYEVTMAVLAVASLALASAVVAGCYLVLYRRFDVVILHANSDTSRNRIRRGSDTHPIWFRLPSQRTANRFRLESHPPATWFRPRPDPTATPSPDQAAIIHRFAAKTLWRSPLHQIVFLGATACGVGWVVNGLLAGGLMAWLEGGGVPPPRLANAAVGMPFVLLLAAAAGLRGALMLPQDPRANWIFRMREDDAHRPAQLDAVERLFLRLVVAPVLLCTLPLQWAIHGADAVVVTVIGYFWGALLVEAIIRSWRRIPFTCSYIPGKRHVAETVLAAFVVFVFFTLIGRGLVAFSRFHPSRFLIATGLLAMLLAIVRWRRLAAWGQTPLMFDDDPPEFAQPLVLSQ